MAAAAVRLRVIEGSAEPRAAFDTAPSIGGLARPDRLPAPRRGLAAIRMLLAAIVSLAAHGSVILAAMQWRAADEARSEGGTDDLLVIDGVSVELLDSAPSARSEGALPEARPAPPVAKVALATPEADPVPDRVVLANEAPSAAANDATSVATLVTEDAAAAPDDEPVVRPPDDMQANTVADVAPARVDATAVAASPPDTPEAAAADASLAPSAYAVLAARTIAPAEGAPVADAIAPTNAPAPVPAAEAASAAVVRDNAAAVQGSEPAPDVSDASAKPVADRTAAAVDGASIAVPATNTAPLNDDRPARTGDSTPARIVDGERQVAALDVTAGPPAHAVEPVAKPKPQPRPVVKAPQSEQREASVAEPVARGPTVGSGGAGGSSAAQRGRADFSSYQAELAARLRRFRTYPPEAQDQGLSGTAVVAFTVNAGGTVTSASLAKSSGHRLLDDTAVAMVHRASPFPPIPANLSRTSVTVRAPVRFDLR